MVRLVASWSDVSRVARSLPGTSEGEGDHRSWSVKDKVIAWERPLRRSDLAALGDAAPKGAILAVRVPDLDAKDAALAELAHTCFTTPHFNGYPAVLLRIRDLGGIDREELYDVVVEAWLTRAQKRVAKAWLAEHGVSEDDR